MQSRGAYSPTTRVLRHVVTSVNHIYIYIYILYILYIRAIKFTRKFELLGIPFIVIFTQVVREPAHDDSCGPLPKVTEHP
jgi:hypothetical protein